MRWWNAWPVACVAIAIVISAIQHQQVDDWRKVAREARDVAGEWHDLYYKNVELCQKDLNRLATWACRCPNGLDFLSISVEEPREYRCHCHGDL